LQAAFDAHFVQDLIVEAGEGLMHSGQQLLQASLAMCSHAHKKRQLTMLFSGEPFKRTFFLQLKALAIVFQVGFVVVWFGSRAAVLSCSLLLLHNHYCSLKALKLFCKINAQISAKRHYPALKALQELEVVSLPRVAK
jgi:hypothetical protein